MGHSQADKQKTHDRIVEIASRRLREKGLEGVGVADLMKEAGLTVGGFYKHFGSRDDMVAEAMEVAYGDWEAKSRKRGKAPSDISFTDYAAEYLSLDHRQDTAGGCPFAALTADLARGNEKSRTHATDRVKGNLKKMATRMAARDEEEARRKAMIVSCLMTGAVGLSRISNDEAFAAEILDTVREFVGDFAMNSK
ncbi:TetR/AcrR family transcriptional regulator [Rhizobium sp. XQZ8]|uniref:TetR/AcrR family transcriptional regulator n=1 Tax=Rhizobium populisoli TaxID=2859785 RepID=UPI001C669588|nr:TetR/AcrR family transcriptional regulator [Rhizobium populisoli]MBW6423771.1 TetR/AcrR family transcriptional regulator [Rhizobium populisoli]